MKVSSEQQQIFANEGVVYLPGVFNTWIDKLKEGIRKNLQSPGPSFADNVGTKGQGRFWDDYCNWTRIEDFEDFIRNSPAAVVASQLMGSGKVQVFHEHVLVKEPGTAMATPWHQDSPYYFVHGKQTLSFWIPLDPVNEQSSLRFLAGSHLWDKEVLPVSWADNSDFYNDNREKYRAVPEANSEEYSDALRVWEMQPGDAVAFHFRTVHGANGNPGANRRRAFSLRLLGDDARYIERQGKTSPPFPGHNMQEGQVLREDWFPTIYTQ